MILVIDNYDSFVYMLVHDLGAMGVESSVVRNDRISVAEVREQRPDAILISPGPCTPREAGVSLEVVRELGGEVPILGVCLGHQAIGMAFGAQVVRAPRAVHGKPAWIHHDGRTLFRRLPNPFEAARYHSLVVRREGLPACFEVSAWTDEGLIMGMRHRSLPIEGVQFHPESIMTPAGPALLENFVRQVLPAALGDGGEHGIPARANRQDDNKSTPAQIRS